MTILALLIQSMSLLVVLVFDRVHYMYERFNLSSILYVFWE